MADESFKGYQLQTVEYEVCREKIKEYVEAVGDTNPVYRDREAARRLGYRDVIAPPTFAASFTTLAYREAINNTDLLTRMQVDRPRVVHGSQHYRFTRPVEAGDQLTVETRFADIFQRNGMWFLVLDAEARDAEGQHVVTAQLTMIERRAAK